MRNLKLLFFCSTFLYTAGLILGYSSLTSFSLVKQIQVFPVYPTFEEVIKNNFFVILYETVGGLIFLPTINSLFFSGFTLGIILRNLVLAEIGFRESLLLILPHGILEIPAIIIAGAAGFKIPYEITRYLAGKKEQILTKEDIKEYLTLALISIIFLNSYSCMD